MAACGASSGILVRTALSAPLPKLSTERASSFVTWARGEVPCDIKREGEQSLVILKGKESNPLLY